MAIKTPFVAVDGIIKLYDSSNNFQGIIFIERKNPPFGIALPGGFVDTLVFDHAQILKDFLNTF